MVNDVLLPIDNLEKIDPKNLEEKVEKVEKDMEGEVKSVATNAKKEQRRRSRKRRRWLKMF